MDPDGDDPRISELETLEAIYPEITRPDENDVFIFELQLPVDLDSPLVVSFPAASAPSAPVSHLPSQGSPSALHRRLLQQQDQAPSHSEVDSQEIFHLPPLHLRMRLPKGYPAERPLSAKISTEPRWLPDEVITRLEKDAEQLWEDMGRDVVAYAYIDQVQRAAEDFFGIADAHSGLAVDPQHKLAILDYDIKAKKAAFDKETFECEVCLDPKKGSKCHRLLDCGHVFCLDCLFSFYNDAIDQGELETVKCLTPGCAKDRAESTINGKPAKRRQISISPSELLQIGLSQETVKRYVNLKYKKALEADKNTIYCPRKWCNGAARSKNHKKPDDVNFAESEDHDPDSEESEANESEDQDEKQGEDADKSAKTTKRLDRSDLLVVCEDCSFAFCSRCMQGWHGAFVVCTPKRDNAELSAEEKASLEYINLHSTPCPTCDARSQKTSGCNHMICSRCATHFCYLCSAWLDPGNPYWHYNNAKGAITGCYMRLWELEEGDGDDVGLGYNGGRQGPPVAAPPPVEEMIPDLPDLPPAEGGRRRNQRNQIGVGGRDVVVNHEAPLVLRLSGA